MPVTNSGSPGYPQSCSPAWVQITGSHGDLRFDKFAGGAHRTQGNKFSSSLKDMRKDTDGEPGEDERGAWSGRVPSPGTPVPVELGCVTILVHGCVHPPGSSPNPLPLRFYGIFLM